MFRLLWPIAALSLSFVIVGCGSNPRGDYVASTVQQMENAAAKISLIKDRVEDALKKAEKDKATPDFKEAIDAALDLRKMGKEMQDLKVKAQELKSTTTDDERKELAETYRARLNSAITKLTLERKALNEVLLGAEQANKEALKDVRAKVREAEGEFEVLSRR